MAARGYIRQLGGETLIYGLGNALNRFIALLLVPIYTRVFSTDQYGVIATFTSFLIGAFIVGVLGLDSASARWFYERKELDYRQSIISSWFWFQTGWGLAVSLVIILLARPILKILAIPAAYHSIFYFVVALIFMNAFSRVAVTTLRLLRRPWVMVAYSLVSSLLIMGGVILFVVILKKGLTGFYMAQITMAVIASLGGIILIQAWIPVRLINLKKLWAMLRFGLPIVPVGLFQWVITSSDKIFLGNLTNSSEVGIYAVASSLTAPILLLTLAFSMAYGPFSMSLINHPASRHVYSKVLSIYAALGCFICTTTALFAPEIVALVTTPRYRAAAGLMPFLAFAGLINGAVYIAITGLNIAKKTSLIVIGAVLGAATNVSLNLILIPHLGRLGAALAYLASASVSVAALFLISQMRFRIPYDFKLVSTFLAVSWILVGADIFFLRRMPRPLLSIGIRGVLCLLFLPLMFQLKLLRKEYFRPLLQFFYRTK